MDKQSKKPVQIKFLLGLLIALFAIGAIICLRPRPPKLSSATEEAGVSKKQTPPKPAKVVLPSALAGSWYDADAEMLTKQLEGFFQKADVKPINDVIALILPHAGPQWSGQTAAFGLKTTNKKYKRIVVIGPSHRAYMEQMLSVPRATHYETPLGLIPLDTEFIDKLLKFPMIQNLPHAHQAENSIEMELPLLQYCQKDFKLVPIVTGTCSLRTIREAGRILKSLIDNETLVVASSDFVHYGRRFGYLPFTEKVPEQIKKVDMGAYEYIEKLDEEGFLRYKQRTRATICGCIPVAILLSMLDKGTQAGLAKYATSGELTGDFSSSVSYLSVAFAGKWKSRAKIEPHRSGLTEEDKEQLLALARKSVLYALNNPTRQQVPALSDLGVTVGDACRRPRAAFVTLKKNARLRGCIGDIFPRRPLYRSVIANAINAAVNDRRFAPVKADECSDIKIEISALTPPEPVQSYDQIRIGTDGVVLRKNGKSAVFLPQVAPEQGWDLNQTLTRLSLKAKLPADAWKEGAGFLVFQADVFGENEK
jgi:AmmeMemoRadiSam system protein B/AmmeMemoRadiSam system protein A